MSDLVNVLPVLGALVLGGLLLGPLVAPKPAPVPVRTRRPRR